MHDDANAYGPKYKPLKALLMQGLLEGKVIVVTGAGVGKGIAMEAARQDAKVPWDPV